MRKSTTVFMGILALVASCNSNPEHQNTNEENNDGEVSFVSADSIKIYGDLYELNQEGPTILLFHQGGSNARGEYRTIVPELIEMGYNVIAIDQRMGGQLYGSFNRTIADIHDNSFESDYGYCDAYNNLEGALDYLVASGFTGPKILWGSSYSASLAIQLAHHRPEEINGVLAFSPASGGPMAECRPDQYFETLEIPLLLLRPPQEMENESALAQFELAEKHQHQTFVPKYGVHGASMLVAERVKEDVSETWKVVVTFLKELE